VLDNAAIAELLIREAGERDWLLGASAPARRPRGFHVVGGNGEPCDRRFLQEARDAINNRILEPK